MAERPAKTEPDLLIQGLMAALPSRDKPFPKPARDRWMKALRASLDLIYGDDDYEETPDG